MDTSEFDKFADEYHAQHAANVRITGEAPEYFAEQKVVQVRMACDEMGATVHSILDFGGGVGNSVPYFRRHFPEAALVCTDVSTRSLEIAASRFPGQADYRPLSGPSIAFKDESFDLVFAACVFHHIDRAEYTSILAELARVTRRGGRIFLFEHNPLNPLTVRAVRACPFDENAVLAHPRLLARALRGAGFVEVRRRYTIFFPHFLRRMRCIERYLRWCPLGAQYYVFATK